MILKLRLQSIWSVAFNRLKVPSYALRINPFNGISRGTYPNISNYFSSQKQLNQTDLDYLKTLSDEAEAYYSKQQFSYRFRVRGSIQHFCFIFAHKGKNNLSPSFYFDREMLNPACYDLANNYGNPSPLISTLIDGQLTIKQPISLQLLSLTSLKYWLVIITLLNAWHLKLSAFWPPFFPSFFL